MQSPDQPGDNCSNCGHHYSPSELIDPRSTLGNFPSSHHRRTYSLIGEVASVSPGMVTIREHLNPRSPII
jgi:hypothetical protein